MRLPHCCFTLLILLVPIVLAAQTETETTHPIDSMLAECQDQNSTTLGMVGCCRTAMELWDAELNRNYNELLTIVDDRSRKALRKAQREWITLRDQEFEFMNTWYGSMQGTIWQIVVIQQKMEFVRKRALELRGYIDSINLEG